MTLEVTLDDVVKAEVTPAKYSSAYAYAYLTFTDADGCGLDLFVPETKAKAMALAFDYGDHPDELAEWIENIMTDAADPRDYARAIAAELLGQDRDAIDWGSSTP